MARDYRRFAELIRLSEEEREFAKRRFAPSSVIVVGAVALAFALLLAAGFNAENLGTETLLVFTVSIFLILGAVIMIFMERIRNNVLLNEFSNALFAGAASSGTEFCMIIKRNRSIVYFNVGFHKYFMLPQDDESPNIESILAPHGFSGFEQEQLNEAILEAKTTAIPFNYRDVAGNVEPLILDISPIQRPKDYFLVRGIKQSHFSSQSQEKISAVSVNQGYLQRLFAELPMGVFITDSMGTLLYCNEPFAHSLGYEPSELVDGDKEFKDLIYGGETVSIRYSEPWIGETIFKTKNQVPYPVRMKGMPITGDQQNPSLYYAFVERSSEAPTELAHEIAVKKGAPIEKTVYKVVGNAATKETAKHSLDVVWHYFLEQSPVAAAQMDSRGIVIKSNALFRSLAQKQDLQAAGWPVTDMLPEAQRKLFHELVESASTSTKSQKGDFGLKDKADISMTLTLHPIAMEKEEQEQKGAQLVLYAIDNSQEKSLEKKFAHSQKMQAVGQLAGGIAHDFNNLLTAMIGFCDLLLQKHPPGDQSFPDLMQIKQNANRAANLVRQLLAFSRRQTLQPVVTDITDTLAELSNLVRRLIGENIELKMNYARDLWLTRVDHGQLEQVIINLAVNARDAMHKGGALEISTENLVLEKKSLQGTGFIAPTQDDEAPPGEYVVIDIHDTGHGIPPEIIQQIFEPFFTTKEVGSGTGLGLATVHGVVKQTGGYVLVKSELGKGTTFRLLFKRHIPKPEDQKKAEEVEQKKPRDLTGTGTILLVEDEDAVRAFSARALSNKGYSVLEADCGEAGIQKMQEHGASIDLIVTDVVMPGITGPSMIEEIIKTYPRMKVVFISGYGEDMFARTFGSDRSFHFLPKPYSLEQLVTKVKEVLEAE